MYSLRQCYCLTSCKNYKLLSLIRHLNHARAVVVPGITFLPHLIELSSTVPHLDHHIHLHARAHSDLLWWLLFVENWNGISQLPLALLSQRWYSWRCEVHWQGSLFQLPWPENWELQYCSKGAGSHCNGSSNLGAPMDGAECVQLCTLQQLCSCASNHWPRHHAYPTCTVNFIVA